MDGGFALPEGLVLTDQMIEEINGDENGCYQLGQGHLRKVEFFSDFTNRYYSLMPTEAAPTMLISGIPMHRIKDTNPMLDTHQKLKALGAPTAWFWIQPLAWATQPFSPPKRPVG